jgi:hypothetical protein
MNQRTDPSGSSIATMNYLAALRIAATDIALLNLI